MRIMVVISVCIGMTGAHAVVLGDDDLVQRGKDVYDHYCSQCHDRNTVPGSDMLAGPQALSVKYEGRLSPYIDEREDLADVEALSGYIRNGAVSMPPFRKTEVSDDEIIAIAAYIAENSSKH
jgi:mono/diheme cytochrome c family protein